MNYLVTGNRGFIGSHLMDMIEGYGLSAVGLDKLEEYPTVETLVDFMTKNKVVGVYHLGARPFIPDCYGNSIDRVVESNISFTADLLLAAKTAEIKRFVYLSTSEVFGNATKLPINEKTPISPQSTYAVSKYAAEALCRTFYKETGLDVYVMRQFNVYGPCDTHPRIIPKIMRAAKHDTELVLGNVDITRDFTYVTDTTRALMNIMQFKPKDCPARYRNKDVRLFVHGSGEEKSIADIIAEVEKLYGKRVKYKTDKRFMRPADVKRLCADRTLYDSFFRYRRQKRVSFEDGMERTKKWYDSNDWAWENE